LNRRNCGEAISVEIRSWQIERGSGAPPVAVIAMAGAVSTVDSAAVTERIAEVDRAGSPLVLDLSNTTSIDAAIARLLRRTATGWANHGRGFAVAGATGQPRRVVEVLGVAADLNPQDTLPDAVATIDQASSGPGERIGIAVHLLLTQAQAPGLNPAERRKIEDQAINTALPLARTLAGRYRRYCESFDDLHQIAAVGIIAAVRRYDAHRDSGFVAFAVPTVLGELRRHFRDHTAALRLPRRLHEIRTEALHLIPIMAQELQRQPTNRELATRIGVTVTDIDAAIADPQRLMSLDAPLTESGTTLHTMIGHDDHQFDLAEIRLSLRPLIQSLPDDVREILRLRFADNLTQAQIAARVGTSQMTISRTLNSTLARIRHELLLD
jgi:RNA polymerase sigma-B factor